jgi:hypothetical protein
MPPSSAFPRGEPALAGRYVDSYTCWRCKERTELSPGEYHALPELLVADAEALDREYATGGAVKKLFTTDLEGAGFKRAHAVDLHDAGIRTAHEVADLERKAE